METLELDKEDKEDEYNTLKQERIEYENAYNNILNELNEYKVKNEEMGDIVLSMSMMSETSKLLNDNNVELSNNVDELNKKYKKLENKYKTILNEYSELKTLNHELKLLNDNYLKINETNEQRNKTNETEINKLRNIITDMETKTPQMSPIPLNPNEINASYENTPPVLNLENINTKSNHIYQMQLSPSRRASKFGRKGSVYRRSTFFKMRPQRVSLVSQTGTNANDLETELMGNELYNSDNYFDVCILNPLYLYI